MGSAGRSSKFEKKKTNTWFTHKNEITRDAGELFAP